MAPTLQVIIVNWNSGAQLRECLRSIGGVERTGFQLKRVVVVDNCSTDDSLSVAESGSIPFVAIRNTCDRGYGAAANQGVDSGDVDYLLFLNPDTRLAVDSLSRPIRFMEDHKESNIAICGVQLLDGKGRVARHCARFPRPPHFYSKIVGLDKILPRYFESMFLSEWDHKENRLVDHVMGAFWLVRRPVFKQLGGFDENFFLYLEDVDFSFRARLAGWRSYFLADTHIFHDAGSTKKGHEAESLFHRLQSRILYSYKHFDKWSATVIAFGTLILEPLSRVAYGFARFSKSEIISTVKCYAVLWMNATSLVKKIYSMNRTREG